MFFFQNNHQNIGFTPQQCGKAATEMEKLYLKHKLVKFVPRRTRWVTIPNKIDVLNVDLN